MEYRNKVRQYRRQRDLTQEDVAKKIGVSVPYLSQIESGKINLTEKTMRKFSDFFGTPVADIFFADNDRNA